MTPEAIEALHDVALAIDKSARETAVLAEALIGDQRDARARERTRFRAMNRSLAGLGVGLALALALLAVVVVQGRQSNIDRDERSNLATAQRVCSDVVTADVLGRLSTLALQPRFRTNPDGTATTDAEGRPIPLTQAELQAQTETLRRDISRSNRVLTHISDVCYGPNGPDPTPLDGDPTR